MSQLIDLIGQKFGSLTVIERAPNKNKQVYWLCQCDCGEIKEVKSQHLREGKIKSCTHCNANTLIGQTFNNWKVLAKTEEKRGSALLFKCQCVHCGNIGYKTSSELKSNKSNQCNGCRIIDITNERFGKLTVKKRLGSDKFRHSIWECQCDCGNLTISSYGHLKDGSKISCGCLRSKGEEKIAKILQENNIKYEKQKFFPTCRFDTGRVAFFDFYLPDYNLLIEYDGEQHFYSSGKTGWNTEEALQQVQKRDNYKTQWCKENNYTLIRIPYTEYDNINLSTLIPNF